MLTLPERGVVLLPSNKLIGMCHWMGLQFYDWIDLMHFPWRYCNGVGHFQNSKDKIFTQGGIAIFTFGQRDQEQVQNWPNNRV